MDIPDRQTLRLEILKYISDIKEHSPKKIREYLASEVFHLSDSERKLMIPSGGEALYDNRVRWAIMDLRKAGLLADVKPQSGVFKITKRGLKVLKQNPQIIDTKFLMRFSEFKDWLRPPAIMKIEKKEKGKEIILRPGIIVLLDALGTKGIWKDPNVKKISKRWNKFIANFEYHVKKILKTKNLRLDDFQTFSDTIMIIVKTSETDKAIMALALSLRAPFIESMMTAMPLRGCITVGNFHYENKLIIGPAIDEAAEYFTQPQWIGISASPSTNRRIEEIKDSNPSVEDNFYKCNIPLKNSIEQNAWALKWADDSDEVILKESMKLTGKKYNNTRHVINDKLKKTFDISSALKWRNTLKFYELVKVK